MTVMVSRERDPFFLVPFHIFHCGLLMGGKNYVSIFCLFHLSIFNWTSQGEERSVFAIFCPVNHGISSTYHCHQKYKGRSVHVDRTKGWMDGSKKFEHPGRGKSNWHPHLSPLQKTRNSSIKTHCWSSATCHGLLKTWSLGLGTSRLRDIAEDVSPQKTGEGHNLTSYLSTLGHALLRIKSTTPDVTVGRSRGPPSMSQVVRDSEIEECSGHKENPLEGSIQELFTNGYTEAEKNYEHHSIISVMEIQQNDSQCAKVNIEKQC